MTEPVVINELTGSQRSITLSGRALPKRPPGLESGGMLRTKITWYAGNNVATQQVLGVEELDMTLSGVWNDRFIGGLVEVEGFQTPQLARDVVAIFEDIQRSGNTLRFQWGPVVRTGILKEFVPTWARLQDVEWTMNWEWQSRDDATVPRATLDEPPDSSELRRRQNEVDDQLAFEPAQVSPDYRSQVRAEIGRVRGRVVSLFDRVRDARSFALVPLTATRGALADAELLREEGNSVIGDLLETPIDLATGFQDLVSRLRVEVWRREEGNRTRRVVGEGQRLGRVFRRISAPAPLAVVTVRGGGDSLRRIAQRFYGTQDEWRRIESANGLTGSVVPAGTLVVVPPLSNATEDVGC